MALAASFWVLGGALFVTLAPDTREVGVDTAVEAPAIFIGLDDTFRVGLVVCKVGRIGFCCVLGD
jgi:hypothetical protein